MTDSTKVEAPKVEAETKIAAAAEVAALRAKLADEAKRVTDIHAACKGHADIAASAIAEGWTVEKAESAVLKAELETLRQSRPQVTAGHVKTSDVSADVLKCALLQAGRYSNVEKEYDDKTLQAAHSAFRGRLGLKQLLVLAATPNGYTGSPYLQSDGDLRDCLKAAFSTVGLSGILSNTANKFLLTGYMSVEAGMDRISSRRNVSDFKAITSYRLTGAHQFEEVSATGEIKHGTVDEISYSNQAKTYANMIALTRQTIINDDLGALTAVPQKLGRGAKLKANDLFWTVFLDNSTFFASGNNNYITGASTNLQSSSLASAEQKFLKQTDADGKPLGVMPALLLVAPEGKRTAMELMSSSTFYGGNTSVVQNPSANTWQGAYEVVVSSYLSNTNYTGNSTTAWYLLANPTDVSTIEVCYLNGVDVPTVETADTDFNTLGIQMRAYMDMGVTKQDFRGGVKSKGAA